jgi:hypothetical protein
MVGGSGKVSTASHRSQLSATQIAYDKVLGVLYVLDKNQALWRMGLGGMSFSYFSSLSVFHTLFFV